MSSAPTPGGRTDRNIVFISKGTPEDDDFVMWLAPRLEANGYSVFADIFSLETGDRWRREITQTLQTKAVKMLLCCRDATLTKQGVQEEIGIAEDLVKELHDPRFIMPLRLEPFKKVFGVGELQYTNFEGRWADGLVELLDDLNSQNVPRSDVVIINRNWENYRRRRAIQIEEAPETLTSNWLRITELPDSISYFQPSGAINQPAMCAACRSHRLPAEPYLRGFFSFSTVDEINLMYGDLGKFELVSTIPLDDFLDHGADTPSIKRREASNLFTSMLRRAWEQWCIDKGLLRYQWSSVPGFHVTDKQIDLGKKVAWGTQGEKKTYSALRNTAQKKIWQYGVTANPSLWPFPHFKLKARVLFANAEGENAGEVIADKKVQHRSRRTICKGWRNKQWHGRERAFLELLTNEAPFIDLMLADTARVRLDALPMFLTSPVTTALPNTLLDEEEEADEQTFTASPAPEQETE